MYIYKASRRLLLSLAVEYIAAIPDNSTAYDIEKLGEEYILAWDIGGDCDIEGIC
jgi:hypothetical protein